MYSYAHTLTTKPSTVRHGHRSIAPPHHPDLTDSVAPSVALALTADDPLQDGVEVSVLTTLPPKAMATVAQLQGLKSRADLNGAVVRIISPIHKGRHKARIISGGTDNGQCVNVRPVNLLPLAVDVTCVARKPCTHYRRSCWLVCPDCNEEHACRMCHDEKWDVCM